MIPYLAGLFIGVYLYAMWRRFRVEDTLAKRVSTLETQVRVLYKVLEIGDNAKK